MTKGKVFKEIVSFSWSRRCENMSEVRLVGHMHSIFDIGSWFSRLRWCNMEQFLILIIRLIYLIYYDSNHLKFLAKKSEEVHLGTWVSICIQWFDFHEIFIFESELTMKLSSLTTSVQIKTINNITQILNSLIRQFLAPWNLQKIVFERNFKGQPTNFKILKSF